MIGSTTRCEVSGASSLVVPLIVTGRGDQGDPAIAAAAGANTPTHLRIPSLSITCGGPFDTATGHYRDNIVVTAIPTR